MFTTALVFLMTISEGLALFCFDSGSRTTPNLVVNCSENQGCYSEFYSLAKTPRSSKGGQLARGPLLRPSRAVLTERDWRRVVVQKTFRNKLNAHQKGLFSRLVHSEFCCCTTDFCNRMDLEQLKRKFNVSAVNWTPRRSATSVRVCISSDVTRNKSSFSLWPKLRKQKKMIVRNLVARSSAVGHFRKRMRSPRNTLFVVVVVCPKHPTCFWRMQNGREESAIGAEGRADRHDKSTSGRNSALLLTFVLCSPFESVGPPCLAISVAPPCSTVLPPPGSKNPPLSKSGKTAAELLGSALAVPWISEDKSKDTPAEKTPKKPGETDAGLATCPKCIEEGKVARFVGVQTAGKVHAMLRPGFSVLFYRRPDYNERLNDIQVCLPLFLSHMSMDESIRDFAVRTTPLASGECLYHVDTGEASKTSTHLLAHYGRFGHWDEKEKADTSKAAQEAKKKGYAKETPKKMDSKAVEMDLLKTTGCCIEKSTAGSSKS
ncbi:hypothetical protein M3Y99_01398800 [Aphelenchoides fujianensis]|nr:hypothetical protein M3Y99_01398800 [Aphelenchoides fujianensis]